MKTTAGRLAVLFLGLVLGLVSTTTASLAGEPTRTESETSGEKPIEDMFLQIQYLEIVTPSVKETIDALEAAHGVTFGEPVAEFGNARTAQLTGGGRIGVRAPMRETEEPVVRPYVLVDNIEAAVRAAEEAGAQVAMPPMEIPGQGTFAIYILGGIQHGLWQN